MKKNFEQEYLFFKGRESVVHRNITSVDLENAYFLCLKNKKCSELGFDITWDWNRVDNKMEHCAIISSLEQNDR